MVTPVMEGEKIVLVAENGTVHRIHADGMFTDGTYHRFPAPITDGVDKAGTSLSGSFVYFLIKGSLYLLTVAQDKLFVERIGNKTTRFVDACFNAEESVLLALTMSRYVCLFRTLPPLHLRSFAFQSDGEPTGFRYIELQNRVVVQIDDGSELCFALPRSLEVVAGSQPIPIEPIEEVAADPLIMQADEQAQSGWRAPPAMGRTDNVAEYVRMQIRRVDSLQQKLVERFRNISDRVLDVDTRNNDIERRSRAIKNRRARLIDRLSDLIARSSARDIDSIEEEWADLRAASQSIQFNEDYAVPRHLQELESLHLHERLSRVEKHLRTQSVETFYL